MSDLLAFLLYALTQARIAEELPEQIRCCERQFFNSCAMWHGCEVRPDRCVCEIPYGAHCSQVWCGDTEGR